MTSPRILPFLPASWTLVALLWAGGAAAQVLPNGKGQVEFAGLEQWTPERLRACLTKGHEVESVHYCAASLIKDAGMADASVMLFSGEGTEPYYFVTVVEPQHAERVRYRPAIEGEARPEAARASLAKRLNSRDLGAQSGVLFYTAFQRDGEERALQALPDDVPGRDSAVAIWRELQKLDSSDDHERALWALAHDPDAADRVCAAAILMNFADHDITWWTLTDGLRDADPMVRTTCGLAVVSLVRAGPEPVDWGPAVRSLRCLLGGTNLFAFTQVLKMLTATSVSPDLAPSLLGSNHALVLAYLGASQPTIRTMAHEFLKTISGSDRGTDPAAWQGWAEGLAGDR